MGVFEKFLRAGEGRRVKQLAELVPPINALEPQIHGAERRTSSQAKTVEFRTRLANGETIDDLLIEAFAVVREAGIRVLGQRHYDVQLMGGMALHFGWIAEMKTGEGKTLVSTLPVYLNALTQRGVHVVTVNDYLATRDAEWMGQLHRFLGVTVGRVGPDVAEPSGEARGLRLRRHLRHQHRVRLRLPARQHGADARRDGPARPRLRASSTRWTPSSSTRRGRRSSSRARPTSRPSSTTSSPRSSAGLTRDADYEVDEEKRTVAPTEAGIAKVEKALGVANLYDSVATNYVHQLTQALMAKELYHRDKDYLVDGGEVKIVDEFTGRTLEGRRWSDGTHQAVEAKERVQIKDENHTWATVTLQNYFRLYEKLAGMTGTAETEAGEFANTYEPGGHPDPHERAEPATRRGRPHLQDRGREVRRPSSTTSSSVASGASRSWSARRRSRSPSTSRGSSTSAASPTRCSTRSSTSARPRSSPRRGGPAPSRSRPTWRAAASTSSSAATPRPWPTRELRGQGLTPDTDGVGRGVRPRDARALQRGAARRTPSSSAEAGGLYVLGSERHESRRIDNQLRGRSGRQGDPGESRFFLSLEDELMRLFATGAVSWVMDRTLPDDQPIEAKMVTKAIERAQNTVEGRNAEIRKDVLKYDEVMNEQRKVIYARRLQILDNEDLHERTLELARRGGPDPRAARVPLGVRRGVGPARLMVEATQYWPTTLSVEQLEACATLDELTERVLNDGVEYYERHCAELPGGEEMARVDRARRDAPDPRPALARPPLRDGLPARGHPPARRRQQDPLVAWQREGYTMFERLLDSIDDDYLRYITHIEAAPAAAAGGRAGPRRGRPTSPSPRPAVADVLRDDRRRGRGRGSRAPPPTMTTVVKSPSEKLGRNEPCWCGSGKKFKFCHGRA